MLISKSRESALSREKDSFNWPMVGFLLFMTGIPAIPAIFILAFVILGLPDGSGFASMINATYFEQPAAVIVHGASGILFFLTMPFQFAPALRNRYIKWHKMAGKIAVLAGYVLAVSGVWMHHTLSPNVFGAPYVSLVTMSAMMCGAFSLALWHIINKNVELHRKWMIRGVAVTLAAVTPLFLEALIYLVFGQFDGAMSVLNSIHHNYGRIVCIVINLAVVETAFIRTRYATKIMYSN